MGPIMKINHSVEKDQCLILELEKDISQKTLLINQLKDILVQGYRHIVIDLKKSCKVDAAGLGALAAAWKTIHASGGEMKLVCISGRTRRVLQVTGMDAVFEIYNTSDQAIASFSKTARIKETEGFETEPKELVYA